MPSNPEFATHSLESEPPSPASPRTSDYVPPIHRLPNELLVQILTQTWTAGRNWSMPSGSSVRLPSVPLVCSRWRAITVDCPAFWAAGLARNFGQRAAWSNTELRDCAELAALLQRSRPYPVPLWLTRYDAYVTPILRLHLSRLTSLDLTVYEMWEFDDFYDIFAVSSFPVLEELACHYPASQANYDDDDYEEYVDTYDTTPLPDDRLPCLRRLTIPGFLLAKTAPASLRHLTVEWDRHESHHIARISQPQDLLSALARCRHLETLAIHHALPEAQAYDHDALPVELPALRSLYIADFGGRIGRVLPLLDVPVSAHVHIRAYDPHLDYSDYEEELECNGLLQMLPPGLRLPYMSWITRIELVFWAARYTHWVAMKCRRGDEEEERICADLLTDSFHPSMIPMDSFNPAMIVDILSGPGTVRTTHLTHLSILHMCNKEGGSEWSWDLLLLASPHLVSLDVQGLHVADVLLALEQASDPTNPSRTPCPALESVRAGFECGTDNVEEQYLQEGTFPDVETLIRARVASLARMLRRRDERGAIRLTALEFFDTYYANSPHAYSRQTPDVAPLRATQVPPVPVVEKLLEPLRTLVESDGRVVCGGYRLVAQLAF